METKPIRLKNIFLAFLVLCLVSLACLTPALLTPGDYVEEFGGDVAVYTRILEMTDCTELRRELERAEENAKQHDPGSLQYKASIGYKTAAENRIREVECEGDL
jgi:hypothetical protein